MKNTRFWYLFGLMMVTWLNPVAAQQVDKLPQLLIRLDDIGMNHSVNMAAEKMAQTGLPFSVSLQFACPWYQEAVEILKKYPNVSVGVHLTLTSEWKNYRWGPVTGRTAVPGLVDEVGYFPHSTSAFAKSGYKIEEVETELSAQIERALASGLKITYIDPHMGIALSTPELRALTEKLAHKYKLAISTLSSVTYFGETYMEMWGEPIATKKKVFLNYVSTKLNPNKPNLVVIHTATPSPEMDALVDMNSNMMNTKEGKPLTSLHRQTELNMLLSPEFRAMDGKKFRMINYAQLLAGKDISILKAVDNK
ncbi:ChbG/HpnK family deacetylase [Mucilaginibacter sp. KACC 22773]|uniref:ChbG/HpnK family deacetylase n=1 Tax=Mucilaginibacter sp. KACC 22773 TaxID=3025671 RepID=UPI002365BE56|nr:ChbG/HpnK family deacetylase [Mucilaginibacter sp. KACC 22773]WDF79710.1 ChbG/HpnK family deacetylase [Mucilaginibacter sp. KACC 22773]